MTQAKHNSDTSNFESFDLQIDQEFIEENKKIDLVRHRQNHKHKFAPFTRSQRRKRRMEVYRLHFEKGIPAIRIADMMNVDRNTINNDLKILYNKAINNYHPNEMTFDDILQKQLVRLEAQRDRLGQYLYEAKDLNSRITIERLMSDIDFRLLGLVERLNQNIVRFWDEVIKQINKSAENEKMKTRYTSLFELNRISMDSRKSLDELKEETMEQRKHVYYTLNVNLDICLKICTSVIQKISNIDARISPDGISSDTSIVNLFFTKPGSKIPIIRINVTTTEVHLEKHTFNISIRGTIDETESTTIPFADIDIDQIIKDYKNLNPLIKEGISHSVTPGRNPNRIASRSLVVKYRMFDRMYEEDEHHGYDINENEIAKLVLPYVISMQEIYSRMYQAS